MDLIERQAAIDAHYEYCNKHPDAGFPVWSLKILEDLPSAQPDSKELSPTHKALDTISRQAAIDVIGKKSDEIYKTKQKGEKMSTYYDSKEKALDDNAIIEALSDALQIYEDGGLLETRDLLLEIIEAIDEFTENYDG